MKKIKIRIESEEKTPEYEVFLKERESKQNLYREYDYAFQGERYTHSTSFEMEMTEDQFSKLKPRLVEVFE